MKRRLFKEAAGWHPAGISAGAAVGAVVGAAIGTAVGGPVGAAVGGALCAAMGALFGQTAAETLKPTEEVYWLKTSPVAIASKSFARAAAPPAADSSARGASAFVTPPAGTGSPLAVSGLRFPARSVHKKESR